MIRPIPTGDAARPRVAYVISQYPASSHTFIRREVEALRAQGLWIETFSVRPPSPAERAGQQDQAAFQSTWYVLPARFGGLVRGHLGTLFRRPARYGATLAAAIRHRPPGLRAFVWALFHFVEAVLLARELERRRVDRVHAHFANAGATVAQLASQLIAVPWSLTLHGISETDYPAGLTLPRKIACADFVACVSWFGRAQAMRIVPPENWAKMRVVRCGLNLRSLDSVHPGAGPARDIICVGRLSPEKGHLGLLEAFAAVAAEGFAADLLLVGDGPDRASVETRCAELGLSDRVQFLGRLDEVATLAQIARAKLLVLPSFMEGLPIVLMEAMALGVPVIASRVAGVPELIEDGREGLLFRPGDWADLTDKLRTMLDDESGRRGMIDAARAKVRGEFDVAKAVAPLISIFSGRPVGKRA